MRIGIDAITPGASLAAGAGGMGHYLASLTDAISRCAPATELVIFESRENPIPVGGGANVRHVVCKGVPHSRTARIVYQNTVYPVILRRAGLDVILGTCNVMPLGSPRPFVVVSQSLQFYKHRTAFGRLRGLYLRATVRASLRAADAVIAVSQVAKDEAVESTGVDPRKVHVVHHGVFPAIREWQGHADRADRPEAPYVLTVCTLYRYKNVERLLEAFAWMLRKYPSAHRLRIIGSDADMTADSLRSRAAELGVLDRVDFLGAVENSQLPGHYAGADLFVYPSLYETFGIPPLEAMTLGCPVVAARATSIPEVVGDSAELVDPLDVESIAQGMTRVLTNVEHRAELIRRGYERVKLFTWQRAAAATLDVLTEARNRYARDAA